MKLKYLAIKFIYISVFLFAIVGFPNVVMAWDDCPKGLENDPYPGNCSRYIDTDNNGICDHSEPAPEDRIKNVNPVEEENVQDNKLVTETNSLALNNSEIVKDNNSKPEQNSHIDKYFLSFTIVLAHLLGFLIYASYKKRKANSA